MLGSNYFGQPYFGEGYASSGTVKTKTQTGVSRISNTVTKTQSGVARIQKTVTKTQSSVARIQVILTKTQSAVAKITTADCYWVGGTGNWSDNTNHWSYFSGGSPGAPLPTSTNNVHFDANSFSANNQTVTIQTGVTANAKSVDWTGVTQTGIKLLFGSFTALLNVFGNWTSPSNVTLDYSGTTQGTITWQAAGTLNTGGASWLRTHVTVNMTTSTDVLTLGSDYSNFACNFTVTQGGFDTGGYSFTPGNFVATSSNTGSVSLHGSQVYLGGGNIHTVWTFTSSTITLNAGTSTIHYNFAGTRTFEGGGKTYYNLQADPPLTNGLLTLTINGSNTFHDFKNVVTASSSTDFIFASGTTQTINGTFNVNGVSGTLTHLTSSSLGSIYTISAATTSISYVDVKDSTAAGTAIPFNDEVGGVDSGNNTNWKFAVITQTAVVRIQNTVTKTQSGIARISKTYPADTSTLVAKYDISTVSGATNASLEGQSFIANGKLLSSAQLALQQVNGGLGTVSASIYAETHTLGFGIDSVPTGSALATSDTVNASTISPSSYAMVTFTFTGVNRIPLADAKAYVVVFNSSNGGASIGFNNPGAAPGNRSYSIGVGTWGSYSNNDYFFGVYGTPLPQQTAKASIGILVTKTQTAVSRISNTLTKTQTAVAKVLAPVTKTQTAKAAIGVSVVKTQSALSRIVLTVIYNQTAHAVIIQTPHWVPVTTVVDGSGKTVVDISGSIVDTVTGSATLEDISSGTKNENIQSGSIQSTVTGSEGKVTL